MSMTAYELETLPELEADHEWEWEGEYEAEGEYESEEFFRGLASLARRAAQSPALRRAGLQAARAALGGFGPVGGIVGGLLPQQEFEFDSELEGGPDQEVSPLRRVYPDALMEHLGHAAAEAESEEEAEAFIGALIPLAARVLPQAASVVSRVAPQLIRGAAGVARSLRSNPTTAPLVRALPTIVRGTVANLAGQVAKGRPITGQGAVRALAAQTQRVLTNPQRCVHAYRRSQALDRRYHRVAKPRAGAAAAL